MENKKVEKKGKKKLLIVLIIVILLLVVGAGGYLGYTLFLKNKGTAKTNVKTQQQVQQIQQTAVQQTNTTQTQSYLQQVVSKKTFALDEILINLADEDGKRYLKVRINVGYDESKLDSELTDKKPLLTDAAISVFRSKKASEITPKAMDNIKMELLQRMNPLLEKGQLNNIYFSDILVQ